MHTEPIDDYGNYKMEVLTRFHKQLESLYTQPDIYSGLTAMQDQVSTNPMDRVAGLALHMYPTVIPAYYESGSLDDAWTALVNTTHSYARALLLFQYPAVGLGCKKWRPTWDQVMTEPLPAFVNFFGEVHHDDKTDEDWVDAFCIENGLVQGLDMGSTEGVDQWGELVVPDADGTVCTFKIHVPHQVPIPEGVYTLLCSLPWEVYDDEETWPIYWTVGQRMPGQRFQKVSIVVMDNYKEVERPEDLHGPSMVRSCNVLL